MSLFTLIKSWMVAMLLCMSVVVQGTEIIYMPHPLADFVHFLYEQHIVHNLKLRLAPLKQYTYDYNVLNWTVPRGISKAEQELLYGLTQINSMTALADVVDNINDDKLGKQVYERLEKAHAVYQTSGYTQPALIARYAKMANQLVAKEATMIQAFLNQMYIFYGTAPTSWDQIIVHPCSVRSNDTYLFYNKVFLAIQPFYTMDTLNVDLGTVIHETAHAIYDRQAEKLQHNIEAFFLHYPSPYAPLAYRYLNEALATVLGNGLFMERLTGCKDMNYGKSYIQGLAEAIYNDVAHYMAKQKTMDEDFLKKVVRHFAKKFPTSKNNLKELFLEPFSSYCYPIWLYKHYHTIRGEGYYAAIDDIPAIEANKLGKYYDCNMPVCFVMRPEEVATCLIPSPNHPYLKEVAKSKLKYLQKQNKKGLYMLRAKYQRPYLFFIIDRREEFDSLMQALHNHPYLPDAGITSILLQDQKIS